MAIPSALPQRHVFVISHYSQRGRGGRLTTLLAGLGASGNSLPLLVRDKTLAQGASEIIALAEAVFYNGRTLSFEHLVGVTRIDNLETVLSSNSTGSIDYCEMNATIYKETLSRGSTGVR